MFFRFWKLCSDKCVYVVQVGFNYKWFVRDYDYYVCNIGVGIFDQGGVWCWYVEIVEVVIVYFSVGLFINNDNGVFEVFVFSIFGRGVGLVYNFRVMIYDLFDVVQDGGVFGGGVFVFLLVYSLVFVLQVNVVGVSFYYQDFIGVFV